MRKEHLRLRKLSSPTTETKVSIRPTYIWDRMAAFVVDSIAVMLLGNLASSPLKRQLEQSILLENDGAMFVVMVAICAVYALVFLVYHTLGVFFFKTTLGKYIFKIQVRSIWENRKLSLYSSFYRALIQLFSFMFLGIPFLALFYDPKRRVLHEKITETYTHATLKFSTEPKKIEQLWIHVVYAIILAHVALIGGFQYESLKDKYATLSELITHPEYMCEDVTTARDSWSDLEESRLDVALALYNANMIDEDCLEVEAQRAISFEEEQDKGYLAMGLIHQGNSNLSGKYIDQVCEFNSTGEPCLVIQLLEAFSSENYELSHQILSKWKEDMSTYASIIAIRQFYFEKKYSLASEKINELWEVAPLKNFLSMYRTLIHYDTKSFEKAQEAFVLTYPDLDYEQQKAISAMVCEKEAENSCQTQYSQSCKKLEENIMEAELGELSDREFVSYLKYASCPGVKMTDAIDILGSKVETTEQVALIAAFRAEQQGRYDVEREFLEQILAQGEEESEIVHQARLMLIKRTYEVPKLKEFVQLWEKMGPYHPFYFAMGMQLFNQFINIKNSDLAYQVGQFLELSYQDHPDIKLANVKLMKLNQALAQQEKPKMEFRKPASEESSTK